MLVRLLKLVKLQSEQAVVKAWDLGWPRDPKASSRGPGLLTRREFAGLVIGNRRWLRLLSKRAPLILH